MGLRLVRVVVVEVEDEVVRAMMEVKRLMDGNGTDSIQRV